MSTTPGPRLKEIMASLVRHLHSFAREGPATSQLLSENLPPRSVVRVYLEGFHSPSSHRSFNRKISRNSRANDAID